MTDDKINQDVEEQARKRLSNIFDSFNTNNDTEGPGWAKELSFALELNLLTNSKGYLSIHEFANLVHAMKINVYGEKFKLIVKALNFKGRGLEKKSFIEMMVILKEFLQNFTVTAELSLSKILEDIMEKYDDGLTVLGVQITKPHFTDVEFRDLMKQKIKLIDEERLETALNALGFTTFLGSSMDPTVFIELLVMVDNLFESKNFKLEGDLNENLKDEEVEDRNVRKDIEDLEEVDVFGCPFNDLKSTNEKTMSSVVFDEDVLRKKLVELFKKYDSNDRRQASKPAWMEGMDYTAELNFSKKERGYLSIEEFGNLLELTKEEGTMIDRREFRLVVKALNFRGKGLKQDQFVELIAVGKRFLNNIEFSDEEDLRKKIIQEIKKHDTDKGLTNSDGVLNEKEFKKILESSLNTIDKDEQKLVLKSADFLSHIRGFVYGMPVEAFVELFIVINRLLKTLK